MSEAFAEMLVRRRSSHDMFSRTPSTYEGISKEELDELKTVYFLDDDQVATYVSSFRKYDADKSGDIDSVEIGMLLRDLGLNFPPADVYDMIQAVDLDGSGSIGLPEFISLIADPEGPLGVALADNSHEIHVDPRQAWLKRKHLEVRIKQDEIFRASRANFEDNLKLRVNDFQSDISGRRGWAGGSGCSAVAVSQNGLLIAAADGGGTVVIFRKFPEWEIPEEDRTPRQDDGQHETRLDLVPDKGGEGGMSFSPTSSYAGSHSPASLLSLPHAEFGYQAVATLRHAHRVRSLSWATEPGWPVLAAGSADGRVRIWRPMGEGEVEVNVEAARLKNIKPGKEVVYAVISVGRKIRLGTESVLDWTVDFAKSDDNAFVLYNSRQVINVVLYVRPKTRQSAVQGEFTRSDSLGVGDRGGPQLKRADSLGIGDSQGEGSMAKLIKKKEALVGKGNAPQMFDRVTISSEFYEIYVSPVEPDRIGTIVGIFRNGAECIVEWDPLPEEEQPDTETPSTPPTHKEEETQTEKSVLKDVAEKAAAEAKEAKALLAAQQGQLDETTEDDDTYVENELDKEPLLEFPAATPGALPTGLGSSGRVGEGKSVYALTLHSKAVAMTSIPVYNAAAATELSPDGAGGWFDIASLRAKEGPGAGTGTSQETPTDAAKSNGQETSDAERQHDAYSGQVRLRCKWLRFPEIWEWKSCGTSDRHKDEVTGLTFSWRDWGGPGMRTEELEQVPVLGLTSCCLGGQIKTWEWFWSDAFATDAEGQIMCSIYDEEINSQHANDRGSSRGTSNVPSRDRSRPNTSESIRLSRIQSSGTVNSKATSNSQSNEDRQGRTRSSGTVNSKATNNSQSSQSKGEHTDRLSSHASQQTSIGLGSEDLSKTELIEIQERDRRQREWEKMWKDMRKLAHDGLHIQESDIKLFSCVHHLAMTSYERGLFEEDEDGVCSLEKGHKGQKSENEAKWADSQGNGLIVKRDRILWHGMAFQFYGHQTIWSVNQQPPDQSEGKLNSRLLLLSGSDGNVHVASLNYVPTRMLSELQPDEPPSSTIPTYSTNGATIAEAEEKDLRDGVEDQNDLGQMWTRAWVFMEKLVGAGGLTSDREAGHPRLQVCPVDTSLVAICSGTALEIWVHKEHTIAVKDSQSVELDGDDVSEAASDVEDDTQKSYKWHLLADLKEHKDVLTALAWRLDGRLLVSADMAGHIKFWARGWDKGVQPLQKYSVGNGGWRCYQTLPIPININQRVPEEAADFSRKSSEAGTPKTPGSPVDDRPFPKAFSQGSFGSMGSLRDDYPIDTSAQVLSLTFGCGPCVTRLFAGLDDDTVCVIDTAGLAPLLEKAYQPEGVVAVHLTPVKLDPMTIPVVPEDSHTSGVSEVIQYSLSKAADSDDSSSEDV